MWCQSGPPPAELGPPAAQSFAARGVKVIVLRPVFVAYPEMADEIRLRARDPERYRGPIVGVSRRPSPAWRRVRHMAVDLLDPVAADKAGQTHTIDVP
jgi:hypothetical protein